MVDEAEWRLSLVRNISRPAFPCGTLRPMGTDGERMITMIVCSVSKQDKLGVPQGRLSSGRYSGDGGGGGTKVTDVVE